MWYWGAAVMWLMAVFALLAFVVVRDEHKLEHFCYVIIFIILGILCLRQVH
jgi:hypothetical protein